LAVFGLLFTAIYLLNFFGKVFLGPLHLSRAGSTEITLLETMAVLPALIIAFLLGVAPQIGIALFNPAVTKLVQQLRF
ncbi:MAG TPA: NADH-quinone oxidoreductase subunit M, partial [Verrucomicrobiae bacterium]|nr:NADH-quinone oxidoreductase subunit M [Verrucomicrobiae bacterium]